MKLIVGLGNPGPEYAKTRHNIGFMVLRRLAERHGLTGIKSKFQGECLDGQVQGVRSLLLCPMTYMNLSGASVSAAMRFHKLEPQDILVVLDDIALPAGRLRLRASGSAGGHNGLKDIQQKLSTNAYPRLRFGIDQPGRVPQKDYVLGRFSPQQILDVEPAIENACNVIECWLTDGIDKAMNLHN